MDKTIHKYLVNTSDMGEGILVWKDIINNDNNFQDVLVTFTAVRKYLTKKNLRKEGRVFGLTV